MSEFQYPRSDSISPAQKGSFREPFWKVLVIGLFVFVIVLIFSPAPDYSRLARRVACMSNVKQMGLGCILYSNDFDDTMPDASRWMDQTSKYSKSADIFRDPSRLDPITYGYAFRLSASRIKPVNVAQPKKYMLLFDSTFLGRNAAGEYAALPKPGRHQGRNSVGYLDGHAKSVEAK